MEGYVYETWARRIGIIIGCVYLIPVLGLTAALSKDGQEIPADLIMINGVMLLLALLVGGFLQAAMSARVKIDPVERKVIHTYSLLGVTVRRTTADLAPFERVSLHRLYRGGYRATLLGRDKEVVLAVSPKLGRVRSVAEEAAALTKLKLTDNL